MNEEKFLLDNFSALPKCLWYKNLATVIKDEWTIWARDYKKSKNYICDYSGYHCKQHTLECHEQYIIDIDNCKIIISNVLCLFYPFHQMHHLGYLLYIYEKRNGKDFIFDVLNRYHHRNIAFNNIDKNLLDILLYDNFKDVKVLKNGKLEKFDYQAEITMFLNHFKYDVSMLPNNQILIDGLRKNNLLWEEN